MTEEQFGQFKQSLRAQYLEKSLTLREAAEDSWAQIASHTYHFDHADQDVALLGAVSLSHMKTFFADYVHEEGPLRRKLGVELFGDAVPMQGPSTANVTFLTLPIEQSANWQQHQTFYPPFQFQP